jgi:hypothetical protein
MLVRRFFDIERCGLVREGRLFPYAWWAICRPRTRRTIARAAADTVHVAVCAAHFARFHGLRAIIKTMKLAGLRRVLPHDLQF